MDFRIPPERRVRFLAAAALLIVLAAGLTAFAVARGEDRTAITHGPRDRPWVALTFDADMTPSMLDRLHSGALRRSYDPAILRLLRRERVPATIFVTGLWAQANPSLLLALARDPSIELENHSMDHSAFRECFGLPRVTSPREKRAQVDEAAATISALAGVRTRYFRFPGGCYEESDLALVESLGHAPVTWDVASGDSHETDPGTVARLVLDEVQPGSIIVMHLNGAPNAPATAEALRMVVPELRRRGFRLVTLRRLLAPRG